MLHLPELIVFTVSFVPEVHFHRFSVIKLTQEQLKYWAGGCSSGYQYNFAVGQPWFKPHVSKHPPRVLTSCRSAHLSSEHEQVGINKVSHYTPYTRAFQNKSAENWIQQNFDRCCHHSCNYYCWFCVGEGGRNQFTLELWFLSSVIWINPQIQKVNLLIFSVALWFQCSHR